MKSTAVNNFTKIAKAYKSASLLFTLLLLVVFTTGAKAQTSTCTASNACFNFTYKFTRNNNSTVTLSFTVKTNCGNALSHVSLGLPAKSKAQNPVNSNKNFSYKLENTTNKPFYSVKFETIGEGPKNGVEDTFSYTITSEEFEKMTTVKVEAKASTTVGIVSFNAKGCENNTVVCSKPTATLTGPTTMCNVSDEVYTFSAGAAQPGATYEFTAPEGFIITQGTSPSTIQVQTILEDAELGQEQTIYVTITNACGSSTAKMNVVVNDCSAGRTLPVELTKLEGVASSNRIILNWNTASEKNNEKFEVERSSNGRDFVKVGEVAGNGSTLVAKAYSFTDAQPLAGTSYYRLKQVDFDGASEYSKVIAVEMKATSTPAISVESAYPNPFQNNVKVNFTLSENGAASISFYNLSGKAIITKQVTGFAGANQTEINGLDNLSNGIYIMKVSAGNQTTTQRLVKAN